MCTMIAEQATDYRQRQGHSGLDQSQQGQRLIRPSDSHDHRARAEHRLRERLAGAGIARVAVELTRESARQLVELIGTALERGAEVDGPELVKAGGS